jgi:CysZ protein
MALFSGFSLGINTYGEAHRFIAKHNLWGWVLLPGIVNLLFLILLIVVGGSYLSDLNDSIFRWLGIDSSPEGILGFLVGALYWLIRLVLWLVLALFYLSTYKYIVLIITSPFLSILSQKVETLSTGKEYPFSWRQYIVDVTRGLYFCLRAIIIEFSLIFLLFFLGFIPIIGFVMPIIAMLISFYFYGFGMVDYSAERNLFSVSQSAKFMRRYKGLAIANGMVFYLLFLIPLLGLLIAPAYACVAATLAYEKIKPQPVAPHGPVR